METLIYTCGTAIIIYSLVFSAVCHLIGLISLVARTIKK